LGEWGEIYVLLKLLQDRSFNSFPIISVEKHGKDNVTIYEPVATGVNVIKHNVTTNITYSHLEEGVKILQSALLNPPSTKTGSFGLLELEPYLQKLKIDFLKAPSTSKDDLFVKFYNTNLNRQTVDGFSIKSAIGGKPTILNASTHTNILFKLTPKHVVNTLIKSTPILDEEIKQRFSMLENSGVQAEFSKFSSEEFQANLMMIDSNFPEILSSIVLLWAQGKIKNLTEGIRHLEESNPLNVPAGRASSFYKNLFSKFAVGLSTGLRPGGSWDPDSLHNGGIIVLSKNLKISSILYKNHKDISDFMLSKIYFDMPSKNRTPHEGNYPGSIITESGEYHILLNFQLRLNIM
jgi:hypothetical protein